MSLLGRRDPPPVSSGRKVGETWQQ